jgi:hypothetical protein
MGLLHGCPHMAGAEESYESRRRMSNAKRK